MATDTTAGFSLAGRLSGGPDLITTFVMADATFKKGDMVNLESGQADLGVTNDAAFIGCVLETKTGTIGTTEIEVAYAPDQIYSVNDPVARLAGATLDLSGASGAQTVAATSNADFIVVADCSAADRTLVKITAGNHYLGG